MARDVKKALSRLEQALEEEEEYEEEYDEEEYDEAYEEEADDDEEAYDTLSEEEAPRPGVRYGCLKTLAMLLMAAIAVMLLIITMKIKGLIP